MSLSFFAQGVILMDAYKDAFAKDCGEKSLMMQVKKGSKYQRGISFVYDLFKSMADFYAVSTLKTNGHVPIHA